MNNIVYNMDCMEYMKTCKDNQFDLAIVDPPYGIGWDRDNLENYNSVGCESWKNRKPKGYIKKNWDERPNKIYFDELFRISKNQIIWGGNYFTDILIPTGGWIIWNKQVVMPTFSDGEMAWTSNKNSMKIIDLLWAGYRKCEETDRIHPTQKPIALYKWLLQNYAKQGQTIFDSHVGSGSSRIACYELGFDFIGCELDKDYWEAQEQRFQIEKERIDLENQGFKVFKNKKDRKVLKKQKLIF